MLRMQPFELRGGGLLLAVPTEDDVGRLTEICQDPENRRWTTIPVPYSRSDAETFVTVTVPQGWSSTRELTWAIRDPEDRRVLGVISIRLTGGGRGEIGFNLAPEARGARVASRAVRLVAEYAFDPEGLGLGHLHWWAYVGNWASRRVVWATGFQFEGMVRGARLQRGESRDSWVSTLAAGDPMKPATPWLKTPILSSNRVTLRPFRESDAAALVEACGDPLTQHWLSSLPSPYTHDDARAYIRGREEESAAGRGVYWAAELPDGEAAMGSFSLMGLNTYDGGAEVGYWVHPSARGIGLATEAVALLAAHAFAPAESGGRGLRRLVVRHAAGNGASRKVIERASFRPYGVERAGIHIRGGFVVDQHWYDLLADDWQRLRDQRSGPAKDRVERSGQVAAAIDHDAGKAQPGGHGG